MKPAAIIFDLDGVVVNSQSRFRRSGGDEALESGDYNEFRRAMIRYAQDTEGDMVLAEVVRMIDAARVHLGAEVMIAITARGEEGRGPTSAWIDEHLPWQTDMLIMRPAYLEYEPGVYWREGEPKFSAIDYKREQALSLKDEYDVVAAFDDHVDISHVYWEIGIPSYCVMFPGIDQGTRVQQAISEVVQG